MIIIITVKEERYFKTFIDALKAYDVHINPRIKITSYAFNASIKVLKYLSSFTVMMIINLEPIYGIILSILIWKDEAFLSLNFYIGFVIVLSSIYMNSIYNKRNEENKII